MIVFCLTATTWKKIEKVAWYQHRFGLHSRLIQFENNSIANNLLRLPAQKVK